MVLDFRVLDIADEKAYGVPEILTLDLAIA